MKEYFIYLVTFGEITNCVSANEWTFKAVHIVNFTKGFLKMSSKTIYKKQRYNIKVCFITLCTYYL